MQKLYIVRHFITASGVRDAIKQSKSREPDEAYIADEWINKVGWVMPEMKETTGFKNKK